MVLKWTSEIITFRPYTKDELEAGSSGIDSREAFPCSSRGKDNKFKGGVMIIKVMTNRTPDGSVRTYPPSEFIVASSPTWSFYTKIYLEVNGEDGLEVEVTQLSTDQDTEGNDVWSWKISPSLSFEKLTPSDTSGLVFDTSCSKSDASGRKSDATSSKMDSSGSRSDVGSVGSNSRDVDPEMDPNRKVEGRGPQPASQDTESADSSDDRRGLVVANREMLIDLVAGLRYKQRGSGICVWNVIGPAQKKVPFRYEENEDFIVKKPLLQRVINLPFGVYLCEDKQTKRLFVNKKIESTNHRLAGTEFLVTHQYKTYLPQIYAVYKEKDVIWILQEYIPYSLKKYRWNLCEIQEFARCLLSACRDLHAEGLAHCDLKPANVMVRDPHRPDSLVLIDFESAKHRDPKFCFQEGGYTLTYLPPWHRQILHLKTFHPVLMTADLWAVACLLIPLIDDATATTASKNSQSQSHSVWAEVRREIQRKCHTCRKNDGSVMCSECRQGFLDFLEAEGHTILSRHLQVLMKQSTGDVAHWASLRRLLEYLTDCTNIDHKNVDKALGFLN